MIATRETILTRLLAPPARSTPERLTQTAPTPPARPAPFPRARPKHASQRGPGHPAGRGHDHHSLEPPSTMTTGRPDLYAILGVARNATQAEIIHAYRALLRRHHPDTRAPDDESHGAVSDTTLQQVLGAYTVLRDPIRRADYDRETTPPPHQTRRRPQQPANRCGDYNRSPITAGPVRWHRAPHPPSA